MFLQDTSAESFMLIAGGDCLFAFGTADETGAPFEATVPDMFQHADMLCIAITERADPCEQPAPNMPGRPGMFSFTPGRPDTPTPRLQAQERVLSVMVAPERTSEALSIHNGDVSPRPLENIFDPGLCGTAQLIADTVGRYRKTLPPSCLDGFAMTLLSRVAHHLDVRQRRGRDIPKSVSNALNYIHDRIATPLPLADIAAAGGVSPYHFARLFRKALGLGVKDYVKRHRLQTATQLLLESDAKIAEVAAAAGFASPDDMETAVRKSAGISPTALRKHVHSPAPAPATLAG